MPYVEQRELERLAQLHREGALSAQELVEAVSATCRSQPAGGRCEAELAEALRVAEERAAASERRSAELGGQLRESQEREGALTNLITEARCERDAERRRTADLTRDLATLQTRNIVECERADRAAQEHQQIEEQLRLVQQRNAGLADELRCAQRQTEEALAERGELRLRIGELEEEAPHTCPLPLQPYVYDSARGRLGNGQYAAVMAVKDRRGRLLAAKLLPLRSTETLCHPGREAFTSSLLAGCRTAVGLLDICPAAEVENLPPSALAEAAEYHSPLAGEHVTIELDGSEVPAIVLGVVCTADPKVKVRCIDTGERHWVRPEQLHRRAQEWSILALIMRRFSGTLHDLDLARVSPADTARLLLDVGTALRQLRKWYLCHKDLHTANVLVDREAGELRFALSDFGRASASGPMWADIDAWALALCGVYTLGMPIDWEGTKPEALPGDNWLDRDHRVLGVVDAWISKHIVLEGVQQRVCSALLDVLSGVVQRTQAGRVDDPLLPFRQLAEIFPLDGSLLGRGHDAPWSRQSQGLAVHSRVRARDAPELNWRLGTVVSMVGEVPRVRLDGRTRARVFQNFEEFGAFRVGDRVRGRTTAKEPWIYGTVEELCANRARVRVDGREDRLRIFNFIEPVSLGGFGVGDRVRVRQQQGAWQNATVALVMRGKAMVLVHGQADGDRARVFKYTEAIPSAVVSPTGERGVSAGPPRVGEDRPVTRRPRAPADRSLL